MIWSGSTIRGFCWLIAASVTLLGCDKAPSEPAPAAPVEVAPPAADAPPAAPSLDGVEGDEDEVLEDDEVVEAESEDGLVSAAEAWQLAESAVAESMGDAAFVLTPALPPSWPPDGGKVAYFAYPLLPLESGVSDYKLGRSTATVTLTLVDRSTDVATVEPTGKPLGMVKMGRGLTASDPIRGGEEALFQVATGAKTAQSVRYRLHRYIAWLDANPLVGKDVRSRLPEFSSFIDHIGQ